MSSFNSDNLRSYSQEDVQQILKLAIARQANENNQEFSYQQILEIASELQISPDAIKQAETDWLTQQTQVEQRKAFDVYRQNKFKKRLGNYVIINSFLLIADFIGGYNLSWSIYILLFSAFVLTIDGWNSFINKGEDYEMAFQRWHRQHQIKQTMNTFISRWFKI
ncbi:2TM domain-containing protein [Anabaena sp. FACHB-1237]|uniref:2TM domain-containing protein n=1 Tax=Anabaena sp. FACHB-1237 TaxID=2692769 RepID=UPI001680C6F2|nr:2TM domain-containing protein [Anabaena sp. FACHB-1237]MBD2137390.1 2TM domain-containing protein [Anabaena sp. FACHB-1237]